MFLTMANVKRKKEIREEIKALRSKKEKLVKRSDSTVDVDALKVINDDLAKINQRIQDLIDEKDEIEEEELEEEEARSGYIPGGNTTPTNRFNPIQTYGGSARSIGSFQLGGAAQPGARGLTLEQMEKRGNELRSNRPVEFSLEEMNFRAMTIGSGTVVSPTHESSTLNAGPLEVSSLVDVVKSIPLLGGESYKSGFAVTSGEGDYTGELEDSHDSDPQTDFVNIVKTRITTYFELSSEVAKLSGDQYQEFARTAAYTAIRKKIAKEILIGDGSEGHLKGVFKAPANVIPAETDITVSGIDETTLDKIVFSYGGDESVDGGAYLILNKQDLAAFAAVRATDGKKLYNITLDPTGNSGTISSDSSYAVPFIINSVCPPLSLATVPVDTYCMAYGKPMAYELALFSPITVEESRDFKFKSGMLSFKGEAFVGGSVAAYKGFVRIKKS